MPGDPNPNLNYLHVRLSGKEKDVELTPGYLKWRQEAIAADTAVDAVSVERRLGGKATEQTTPENEQQ